MKGSHQAQAIVTGLVNVQNILKGIGTWMHAIPSQQSRGLVNGTVSTTLHNSGGMVLGMATKVPSLGYRAQPDLGDLTCRNIGQDITPVGML